MATPIRQIAPKAAKIIWWPAGSVVSKKSPPTKPKKGN
jgi:hypothetical protein